MPNTFKKLIQINKSFVELYNSFEERSPEKKQFRDMILQKTGINYETLRGSIARNNFSNSNKRLIALALLKNPEELQKTIKILFP